MQNRTSLSVDAQRAALFAEVAPKYGVRVAAIEREIDVGVVSPSEHIVSLDIQQTPISALDQIPYGHEKQHVMRAVSPVSLHDEGVQFRRFRDELARQRVLDFADAEVA
ncbi:hypothetical protein [Rhizobium sp. Root708]|uniref:hypothetical protein n=1 Tax=Rhizobium sp. Root708 TaxID=1736592 RepID=UPI0012E3800C|nr:hypothetical protein [Rhizobium sp. Root708]